MMKDRNTISTASISLLASACFTVACANEPYVGIYGGLQLLPSVTRDHTVDLGMPTQKTTQTKSDSKAGLNIGARVGLGVVPVRFELEFRHEESDGIFDFLGDAGDIDNNTGLFNVYYDFGSARFKPYLGIGAGFARLTYAYDKLGQHFTKTVPAFQGRAGFRYAFTPTWDGSFDYTYYRTGKAQYKTKPTIENRERYVSHHLVLGLAYNF